MMKTKGRKTTPAEFTQFKAEANRLLAKLGMTDWDVAFEHVPLRGKYAGLAFQIPARTATLSFADRLSDDNPAALDAFNPKRHARHEVLELLLGPLSVMAEWTFSKTEVDTETHAIIQRLEKVL